MTTVQEIEKIRAVENVHDDEIVVRVDQREFSRRELTIAFDRVVDKTNWKYPINTVINLTGNSEKEIATIKAAIAFFTGSEAVIEYTHDSTLSKPMVSVMAAGYYRSIGA